MFACVSMCACIVSGCAFYVYYFDIVVFWCGILVWYFGVLFWCGFLIGVLLWGFVVGFCCEVFVWCFGVSLFFLSMFVFACACTLLETANM